jgi:hypothetical protein
LLGSFTGTLTALGTIVPPTIQSLPTLQKDGTGEVFQVSGDSIMGETVTAIYPLQDSQSSTGMGPAAFCYETSGGVKSIHPGTSTGTKTSSGDSCSTLQTMTIKTGCSLDSGISGTTYSEGVEDNSCPSPGMMVSGSQIQVSSPWLAILMAPFVRRFV